MLAFLDRYEIAFRARSRRSSTPARTCATRGPSRACGSSRSSSAPSARPTGTTKVQEDISVKAQIGRYRIRGYGATRPLPHLTDIAFRHDLVDGRARSRRRLEGRARDLARRPLRRDADRPVDAGDDRADELRRALEVDEGRARERLARSPTSATTRAKVASSRRCARRRSGSSCSASAAGSAGTSTRCARPTASRSTSHRARSPASAGS